MSGSRSSQRGLPESAPLLPPLGVDPIRRGHCASRRQSPRDRQGLVCFKTSDWPLEQGLLGAGHSGRPSSTRQVHWHFPPIYTLNVYRGRELWCSPFLFSHHGNLPSTGPLPLLRRTAASSPMESGESGHYCSSRTPHLPNLLSNPSRLAASITRMTVAGRFPSPSSEHDMCGPPFFRALSLRNE